jgi:hypothetical protein
MFEKPVELMADGKPLGLVVEARRETTSKPKVLNKRRKSDPAWLTREPSLIVSDKLFLTLQKTDKALVKELLARSDISDFEAEKVRRFRGSVVRAARKKQGLGLEIILD